MTAAPHNPAVHNAGELLAANRRRARRRRLLLWIVIPLCVLALLVPAKIASMYAFAHRSITAHVAGDFAGSTAAARGQEVANVFETYKAPYNVGVGLAMSGDLAGARERFERALELDPPRARGLRRAHQSRHHDRAHGRRGPRGRRPGGRLRAVRRGARHRRRHPRGVPLGGGR